MMSWAVALFAALTPLYVVRFSFTVADVRFPTTALELAFCALLALWVGQGGRWRSVGNALWEWRWGVGLFVLGSLLGIIVAENTFSAVGLWRAYILEPLLVFVIARDTLKSTRDRERVVVALAISALVIGITAVVQKITGFGIPAVWQPAAVRRVTSVYGFPNAVGLFLAPLVLLLASRCIALLHERRWVPALFFGGVAGLGIASCVFASSEGALFGIAAGFAVLGLAVSFLRLPTLIAIIAGCVVSIFVVPLRDYLSIVLSLRDEGGYIRAFIWADTWQMLKAHPWLGVGLGNYPFGFAPFRTRTWIEIFQYPHNIFFNFWSEMGLAGLAGFFVLLGQATKNIVLTLRSVPKDWLSAGVLAALAAILVHGLVDVPYFKNDLAMIFWILLALLPRRVY